MLGLAQAARSWDPERGASFERHAATRIREALLDELRDADWHSPSVRAGPAGRGPAALLERAAEAGLAAPTPA
jgi:RNA polymerase sigma factor FliA